MNYNIPKISIVTVCYNSINLIESTIKSVTNQSYSNIEYIIIDGGSTDGTLEIINKYSNRITKVVSERDNGIYDAMNKSLNIVTGEWINFMNAGDIFASNNIIERIFSNNIYSDETAVIYGNPIIVYPSAKFLRNDKHNGNGYVSVCHQCAFTRRKFLKRFPFNIKYKIAADAKSFKDIQDSGGKFYYVDYPIAEYENFNGLSSIKRIILRKEQRIIFNKPKTLRWYIGNIIVFYKTILRKTVGDNYYEMKEIKQIETSSRFIKM